jgi:hypothetical protein
MVQADRGFGAKEHCYLRQPLFERSEDRVRLIPKPKRSGAPEYIVTSDDRRHATDCIARRLRECTEDPGRSFCINYLRQKNDGA